jgi:hypothetical protein
MVQTVFSLSVGILLLVLIVFNDKFVKTTARTYSLAEDGSLQIEGYSVNTVFGNLTAVHDLRVDGGQLKLLHATSGTTISMKDNESASVVFGSNRESSKSLLSIDTRRLQEKVIIGGKLRVDGTLEVDHPESALKLRNVILNKDDLHAMQYIVPDMSIRFNITTIAASNNLLTTNIPHSLSVGDVIYMSAASNNNNHQLHGQYWTVSNVINEYTFKLKHFNVNDFNFPPIIMPIGSIYIRPTKILGDISTLKGEEKNVI